MNWRNPRSSPSARPRQQDPERSTGEREEKALAEKLADDARATGAECQPQGNLAAPGTAARDEQVGDVRRRDEHQHADQAHQDAQRLGVRAPAIVLALPARIRRERRDVWHPGTGPILSPTAGEPAFAGRDLEDRLEAGPGLLGGHAGVESPHDADPPVPGLSAAPGTIRLKPFVLRERKRDVHRFADLHGAREARWRDSNERDRHSVHLDGLADDRRIAIEAAFPEAIGDDADRRRGRQIVGIGQRPARDCGHAQAREIVT